MIYLTSDTHFGHENIIKYIHRPFRNSEEMDNVILNNINDVVDVNDRLYILGDFTMHRNFNDCMKYREQINCKHVHLILGNHDRRFANAGKPSPFETEQDYLELKFNNRYFCLSHYPMLFWNGRDYGSIMCHGHLHSSMRTNEINQWQGIKRFDVGVDSNNFKPVSLDYIFEFCNKSIEEIFS